MHNTQSKMIISIFSILHFSCSNFSIQFLHFSHSTISTCCDFELCSKTFSTYVLMRPNCTILESKYPGWSTKNSTPLTTRNRVVCEFFCVLTNQIEQQQNGEKFWILFYVLYSQFIDY